MGVINKEELSSDFIEYLKTLGKTEQEIIQIIKSTVSSNDINITDSNGTKVLEESLLEINTKINTVSNEINSGKEIISASIGEPLMHTDSFIEMGNKIDSLKQTFKNNLSDKNVTFSNDIKYKELIDKINDIEISQYNMDESILNEVFEVKTNIKIPDIGTMSHYFEKNNEIIFFDGIQSYGTFGSLYRYIVTVDKDTLKVKNRKDQQVRFGTTLEHIYIKLKTDDNFSIYGDRGYNKLKFLDINTFTIEDIQIPTNVENNRTSYPSICKTNDNSLIYVLGGYYFNNGTNYTGYGEVRKYDPITKTWTFEKDLCKEVGGSKCISIKVNNYIYIFQTKFITDDKIQPYIVRYDTLTQTSSVILERTDTNTNQNVQEIYLPSITSNEEDYFIKNNKIYIAVLNYTYVYDITNNTINRYNTETFNSRFINRCYCIFNKNGVFYKCGGEEPHYDHENYDARVQDEVNIICIKNN